MVGRSPNIVGPYRDRTGTPMTLGGGTLLVPAAGRWRGPGSNSILLEDGEYKIIYHAYDAEDGRPKLRIGTLVWDTDGWPWAALPNASP
jgi:arabinan endo-1,5-alpha-L-arabinosidase